MMMKEWTSQWTGFAAVADCGDCPAVWGIGDTEEEAMEDAKRELHDTPHISYDTRDLEIHPITAEQRHQIETGDVEWPLAAASRGGQTGGMTMTPLCVNCGKRLRRYRWRDDYPSLQWGGYGDGHFCGLTCGYEWAVMYLRKNPHYASELHKAMGKIMVKPAPASDSRRGEGGK